MQNDNTRTFRVVLSESTLGAKAPHGYITGTDIVSDVCYALNFGTWEEIEEMNLDYMSSVIRAEIDGYDWETHTRDLLNADAKENEAPEIVASEYLAGDWYEINKPEEFRRMVAREKDRATDNLTNCFPYNPDAADAADAPEDLKKALERSVDWLYDSMRHDWLHGDRSNDGVLDRISRYFTGERGNVDYMQEANTLAIMFTEDAARDFLGYDVSDDEEIAPEALGDAVVRCLLRKVEERQKEAERRRAERQEATTRHKEREQQEAEKRREEARERKHKAGV